MGGLERSGVGVLAVHGRVERVTHKVRLDADVPHVTAGEHLPALRAGAEPAAQAQAVEPVGAAVLARLVPSEPALGSVVTAVTPAWAAAWSITTFNRPPTDRIMSRSAEVIRNVSA